MINLCLKDKRATWLVILWDFSDANAAEIQQQIRATTLVCTSAATAELKVPLSQLYPGMGPLGGGWLFFLPLWFLWLPAFLLGWAV